MAEPSGRLYTDGACPLCNTREAPSLRTPGGAVYSRCSTCATLYLSRRPRPELYARYYRESRLMALFSQKIFPQSHEARLKGIYLPRLEALLKAFARHDAPRGCYVEVGAGSGRFAALMRERGVFERVLCIEPSPTLAADCRAAGLETLELPVEEVQNLPSPATVAAFETLEHLPDPGYFLARLSALLAPGSLLVLSTPNGLGFDVTELGQRSSSLGWTHVHLFNPGSLGRLLEAHGFAMLESGTPGKLDVDLVRRALPPEPAPDEGWVAHFLRSAAPEDLEAFQDFLAARGQSGHMQVIARKN